MCHVCWDHGMQPGTQKCWPTLEAFALHCAIPPGMSQMCNTQLNPPDPLRSWQGEKLLDPLCLPPRSEISLPNSVLSNGFTCSSWLNPNLLIWRKNWPWPIWVYPTACEWFHWMFWNSFSVPAGSSWATHQLCATSTTILDDQSQGHNVGHKYPYSLPLHWYISSCVL